MTPRGALRWAGWAALAAGALWVLLGIVVVRPSQQGVVLRLGVPRPAPLGPGIHWVPRGIDRFVRVEVTRTYTMPVGFRMVDSVRGAAPSPEESSFLTGDTNILTVEMALQYRIARPVPYVVRGREAPEVLRRAAESVVTAVLGTLPVDEALTSGRLPFAEAVRRRTQELLDRWDVGLHVDSVALRTIEPPSPVRAAFQDVQNARSDRERFVNEAQAYANETLPRARGEALARVTAAEGEKARRIEAARGDAARFEAVRRQAALSPASLRERLYLEALEKALPRMTVYVVDPTTSLRLVRPAPPVPAAAAAAGR